VGEKPETRRYLCDLLVPLSSPLSPALGEDKRPVVPLAGTVLATNDQVERARKKPDKTEARTIMYASWPVNFAPT
jgi:hypothetical protein